MSKELLPEIIEEHELNRGTGVEAEDGSDSVLKDPYDPESIRVDTKTFSLRHIMDMIDEQELDLAPDFQRRKVWSKGQKSRLIESLLLRIPLPAFYFSTSEDGLMQVVDGLQRLSTIHDFVRGGPKGEDRFFSLEQLEYLDHTVGGKTYQEMEGSLWARRISNTQITVNVVDPQTPEPVKYDIFRRINTAGSPLNAQEVRHCMTGKRARAILSKMASAESFNLATHNKLKDHARMADIEVVLRFAAFFFLGNYHDFKGGMSDLLTATTKLLEKITKAQEADLLSRFDQAMTNAHRLFGDYAFRKWPAKDDRKYPINRPLFEVWGIVLSSMEWKEIEPLKGSIINAFREELAWNEGFLRSISTSTGTTTSVVVRFSTIIKILEDLDL